MRTIPNGLHGASVGDGSDALAAMIRSMFIGPFVPINFVETQCPRIWTECDYTLMSVSPSFSNRLGRGYVEMECVSGR